MYTHTHTASSDVQNELSGLGVSVYNQDEFEAGVLQQIDQEVTKRNAEQQRKFLIKEYSSVKHEIRYTFSGFSVGFCVNEEKVIWYQLELGK